MNRSFGMADVCQVKKSWFKIKGGWGGGIFDILLNLCLFYYRVFFFCPFNIDCSTGSHKCEFSQT